MEYPLSASRTQPNLKEQIEHGLRLCPIFVDWPEDRLRELACSARLQRYRRRTQIVVSERRWREILVIVSGSIEVAATNPTGGKYILAVLDSGQIIGLVRLLEDLPSLFAYHAREDSEIILIPGIAMRQILDAEPILWRSIAQIMLRRHSLGIEGLQGQVLGSVRRRMAIKLINMAHRYGDQEISACNPELHLSQTDLANMLGVSRQTIGKELARLQDEGILGCNDGYRLITLLDVPGLLRIAEQD